MTPPRGARAGAKERRQLVQDEVKNILEEDGQARAQYIIDDQHLLSRLVNTGLQNHQAGTLNRAIVLTWSSIFQSCSLGMRQPSANFELNSHVTPISCYLE
eukprot:GHVR01052587.1.p1 GENE.GHVR01052587.1~~GHVR01052587.1.p1  ORF type:complete len:101 (-),score=11.18 GHVR01052587.1:444-746(-)